MMAAQTVDTPVRPVPIAFVFENIPAELKAIPQWVTWKYLFRDKWTKPLFNARTGEFASSTNPATWSDYETAVAAYPKGGFDGIGFVLTREERIVGVDLDHCYNPKTKLFEPWATAIIDHFNSYTEASPSGTGVRIFLKGKLPAGGHKKGNIEIYSSGRYLTVTGRALQNTVRSIEPRQAEIDAFLAEHFPEPKIEKAAGNAANGKGHLGDHEIFEIALRAKNGDKLRSLLDGDIVGYPSPSEADLALCSMLAFYSKDETQIDRLYRGSKLFRDKWDEKHYGDGATYGERTIQKAIEGAVESYTGDSQNTDWLEPKPLVTELKPELYPLDALPETIRAAVIEVQEFTKAPIALVASSALGVLSLAIQGHMDVKRAEKLVGPVSLFLLTIADSGERKSTCDEFFTAAIREYQAQQAEAAKPDVAIYRADLAAWEAKQGGIKDKIRQLAKANKPTAEPEAALRDLERDKPRSPRVPRLLRGDDTPESLAWALMHEWPASGVMSSEAAVILGAHGMGKDSIMRNLGLLNLLWDGGSLSIGRRHSESFTVKGVRLTVALQVQEATLRSFFDRSNGLARGTGFLARFLIAWPESTQGFRPFTEAPANWPALAAFNRLIAEVLTRPVPIDDDGALSAPLLSLTPEAKAAWVKFHDLIESELGNGGELCDVRDVASKSADNATRLAALFQILEHGMGCAVGLDAFEGASRIAAWHLNEARRFFGELAQPTELANAARLDNWLIDYCRQKQTQSVPTKTVQQYGPGGLREKAAIESAMHELEELGRGRLAQDGRRRIIMVNPALLVDGGAP